MLHPAPRLCRVYRTSSRFDDFCITAPNRTGHQPLSLAEWRVRSIRGVAQPGSALALGARGPRFESGRPDQYPRRFSVSADYQKTLQGRNINTMSLPFMKIDLARTGTSRGIRIPRGSASMARICTRVRKKNSPWVCRKVGKGSIDWRMIDASIS